MFSRPGIGEERCSGWESGLEASGLSWWRQRFYFFEGKVPPSARLKPQAAMFLRTETRAENSGGGLVVTTGAVQHYSTENTVGTHYRVIFLCMLERNEAIYIKSPISGVLSQSVDYYVTSSLLSAAKEMGPITETLDEAAIFSGNPKTLFLTESRHMIDGGKGTRKEFFFLFRPQTCETRVSPILLKQTMG